MRARAAFLFICGPADEAERVRLIREKAAFCARACALPAGAIALLREPQKKPVFLRPDGLFLSVSHTEGVFAFAIAPFNIGLDVERIRAGRDFGRVARRYFHPDEYAFFQRTRNIFPLWTAKESYVKLTGEGITDGFSAFSTVQNGAFRGVGGARLIHVPFDPTYSMCLCAAEEPALRVYDLRGGFALDAAPRANVK